MTSLIRPPFFVDSERIVSLYTHGRLTLLDVFTATEQLVQAPSACQRNALVSTEICSEPSHPTYVDASRPLVGAEVHRNARTSSFRSAKLSLRSARATTCSTLMRSDQSR